MLEIYAPIINLSYFCRLSKVSKSALSQFLKGNNGALSDEKIQELCLSIDRYVCLKNISELMTKNVIENF